MPVANLFSSARERVLPCMEPMPAEPPYLLAAQASSVLRHLYRRVRDGEPGSTADLARTLGALRLLADELAQVLPGLQEQLENSLLAGAVRSVDSTAAAVDRVAEVGRVLAQARTAGQLMATELRASQKMLGELTAR
jgi:hypothetical protein